MCQDIVEELLERPVQQGVSKLLHDTHELRPVSGNYSKECGLNILSFFRGNEVYTFQPLLGSGPYDESLLKKTLAHGLPIVFCEDSFLRAATVFWDFSVPALLRQSVSLSCDSQGLYFDATRPTNIENIIKHYKVSPKEIDTAQRLIEKIVSNKISKYNNQPLACPRLPGSMSRDKVLVIDQDKGDASIRLGMASDATFEAMLMAAADENPNADILVKTHPDSLVKGGRIGNLANIPDSDRIHKITFPVNPYTILDQVSKVYVCTSTFGFEALLCGKPVSVFGMPWYAGWGVTEDRQSNPRRGLKKTVRELFYDFYVRYSRYANPHTNEPCSIDEAINQLLHFRGKLLRK